MMPAHRRLRPTRAACSLRLLLLGLVLLALSTVASPVGARGIAAERGVLAQTRTLTLTDSQRENTRRFLAAFAVPDSPLHGVWRSGDFCDWPLIRCTADGVHLEDEGFPVPFSTTTVPLPDIPADVNASEVVLTHFSSLSSCTRWSLGGTLPASWAQLPHLRVLQVDSGSFSGTLPPEWGQMRGLQRLTLTGECRWDGRGVLTGTLPAAWASMTSLRGLTLRRHQLSGTLPVQWAALHKLQLLSLSSNNLSGTLPAAWAQMRSIESISIEDNAFAGSLPPEWRAGHFYTLVDDARVTTQPTQRPQAKATQLFVLRWVACACLFTPALVLGVRWVESAAPDVLVIDVEDVSGVDWEAEEYFCDSSSEASDFDALRAEAQPCVTVDNAAFRPEA